MVSDGSSLIGGLMIKKVLILVLVEDGLGLLLGLSQQQSVIVLILVLVEDGLGPGLRAHTP